jgi:hypothetical protein
MNPRSKELLQKVAQAVSDLPNKIEISGHTDAAPYAGNANYSNWELSSDRANASRRVLVENGIDAARLRTVEGKADTEPFVKENPLDPQNRRISIVLLRITAQPSADPNVRLEPPAELVPNEPATPAPAPRTPPRRGRPGSDSPGRARPHRTRRYTLGPYQGFSPLPGRPITSPWPPCIPASPSQYEGCSFWGQVSRSRAEGPTWRIKATDNQLGRTGRLVSADAESLHDPLLHPELYEGVALRRILRHSWIR